MSKGLRKGVSGPLRFDLETPSARRGGKDAGLSSGFRISEVGLQHEETTTRLQSEFQRSSPIGRLQCALECSAVERTAALRQDDLPRI